MFDVRDAAKATEAEQQWFNSYVAKVLLYLAKRVRPECLTTVAFLSTRINECDVDDLAKLKRLLGCILGTSERGITMRIGRRWRGGIHRRGVRGAQRKRQVAHRLAASGKSSIVLGRRRAGAR